MALFGAGDARPRLRLGAALPRCSARSPASTARPLRAETAPGAVAGQIGVRFDANIDPGLPWRFEPVQETVRIHPARARPIYYRATNSPRARPPARRCSTSRPTQAGQYFSKIECFCFTEQTLKPGESVDMPVVFFVDPKIRKDRRHQRHRRNHVELYILPGGKSGNAAARAAQRNTREAHAWPRPRTTIITSSSTRSLAADRRLRGASPCSAAR